MLGVFVLRTGRCSVDLTGHINTRHMDMKKVLLSSVAFIALAGSALAADLPSRKAAPAAPAVPLWTGFYAGLNAGYDWGTNNNASAYALGGQTGSSAWTTGVNSSISIPYGLALSNNAISNTQSGFIGGAQFGYNYQGFMSQNLVLGIETDIQGAGIRGSGRGNGIATSSDGVSQATGGARGLATGTTAIQAGVDYLGTVRGRVGYLWSPTLLAYGTAGFAYGGAWANVVQSAAGQYLPQQTVVTGVTWGQNQNISGEASTNQLLTGWTAGGGIEWMFLPNWSLKGEALYWNLGNMNVKTLATGLPTQSGTVGAGGGNGDQGAVVTGVSNVNYQGVTAKAGINYHFTWGSAPVVASF